MADETDNAPGFEIILFPGHFRRPANDAEILDRAIHTLQQAIAELRENIARWRGATNAATVNFGEITETLDFVDNGLMTAWSQLKSQRIHSVSR